MNLTITGHHLEITPAIRGYIEEKMTRITRHFDQVIDISVILTNCHLLNLLINDRNITTVGVQFQDSHTTNLPSTQFETFLILLKGARTRPNVNRWDSHWVTPRHLRLWPFHLGPLRVGVSLSRRSSMCC